MTKGNYFISGNIEQIESIIGALENAVDVAKRAKQLQLDDDPNCEPEIRMKNKGYSTDENAVIEFDMTITY